MIKIFLILKLKTHPNSHTNYMKNNVFESDNLGISIFKMTFPAILSSLVTVIYNLTDIFFIGLTGDPCQAAAIALSTPIFLILPAIGGIFGMGGGPLISRLLGKKNFRSIKVTSSFCFYAGIISSLLFNIIILVFMERRFSNSKCWSGNENFYIHSFFANGILLGSSATFSL